METNVIVMGTSIDYFAAHNLIDNGWIKTRLENSTDDERCAIIFPYWDVAINEDSIFML